MKIYNLNTKINFGMHKGKRISEILEFSGYEKFDFPELKNKTFPKRKVRKPGEKIKIII